MSDQGKIFTFCSFILKTSITAQRVQQIILCNYQIQLLMLTGLSKDNDVQPRDHNDEFGGEEEINPSPLTQTVMKDESFDEIFPITFENYLKSKIGNQQTIKRRQVPQYNCYEGTRSEKQFIKLPLSTKNTQRLLKSTKSTKATHYQTESKQFHPLKPKTSHQKQKNKIKIKQKIILLNSHKDYFTREQKLTRDRSSKSKSKSKKKSIVKEKNKIKAHKNWIVTPADEYFLESGNVINSSQKRSWSPAKPFAFEMKLLEEMEDHMKQWNKIDINHEKQLLEVKNSSFKQVRRLKKIHMIEKQKFRKKIEGLHGKIHIILQYLKAKNRLKK